jgi:hypothetical protein
MAMSRTRAKLRGPSPSDPGIEPDLTKGRPTPTDELEAEGTIEQVGLTQMNRRGGGQRGDGRIG